MDKAKVTEAVEKGEIVGALQEALMPDDSRAVVITGKPDGDGIRIDVKICGFRYWFEVQGMIREAIKIIDNIDNIGDDDEADSEENME